jgi:hypothetical protein
MALGKTMREEARSSRMLGLETMTVPVMTLIGTV